MKKLTDLEVALKLEEREEPKPHSFCETPKEKCTMNYCDENGCVNRKRVLVEEAKHQTQETLEEAAKNYLNSGKIPNDYRSFIKGAKWQQERMYSEEEVIKLLETFAPHIRYKELPESWVEVVKDWFEQFKKK